MENKITTITLDANNISWRQELDYSYLFALGTLEHLDGLLATRGYLYLNEIYEQFYAAWEPERENICLEVRRGDSLGRIIKVSEINKNVVIELFKITHETKKWA